MVENPAADGFDDYATISIGLTAIARAGISSFNVTIPFEDSNISIPNNVVQIPFLRFDGSAAGPSFVNPISLNVDNGELSINAGNIASSLPALRISSNWGSNRNITSAILNYDSGAAIGTLEADITENISGKEIIRVSPHGITQLPSSDSSGLTTTANLNARIRFYLWRSTPVSVSGGIGVFDYYHSTLDYRVAYNIEYGIAKPSSSGAVSALLLSYAPNMKVYCNEQLSMSQSPSPVPTNLEATISWYCDDTGAETRQPLRIDNRNNATADISLTIDESNSNNNSLQIQSVLNGSLFTFSYSGFSNDITLEEFVTGYGEALASQAPAWITRFPIQIDNLYKYASMKDFVTNSFTNIQPNQFIRFTVVPDNAGTIFTTDLFVVHSNTNATSLTFGDFISLLKRSFGSYGLQLNVFIPNTTEWMDLPVYPTVLSYGNSTSIIVSSGVTNLREMNSRLNAFLDISSFSTHRDQYDTFTNYLTNINAISINVSTYSTVSEIAGYLATRLNEIIPQNFSEVIEFTNAPRPFTVTCDYSSYYSDVEISVFDPNLLDLAASSTTIGRNINLLNTCNYTVSGHTYTYYIPGPYTIPLGGNSYGNSVGGTFAKMIFAQGATTSVEFNIPVDRLENLSNLIDDINNSSSTPPNNYSSYLLASLVDSSYASVHLSDLASILNWNLATNGNLNVNANIDQEFIRRYRLNEYPTLEGLVTAIENDFSSNISVSIDPATLSHSDISPSNLFAPTFIANIKTSPLPKIVNGLVNSIPTPITPTYDVTLSYLIGFASDIGGNTQQRTVGVQVAIGGYEKSGVFYPYSAPNTFFEPVYNTSFPISFTTVDADVVYLLIRTRETTNSGTAYSSNYTCYSGLVKYSNGYPPYTVVPFVPGESKFTSVWTEDSVGVPTVIAVPVYSTTMEISIEDSCIFDSISVQIVNKPSAIDEFGFLAINRTNNNKSQTESKVSNVFGLVLDNRGSWDVMISPEAIMKQDPSGSIFHLGSLYNREVLGDDEGYDFSIMNTLPEAVRNSISLLPIPGNPQVWILRIEHGVKKYLGDLLAANDDEESQVGCYIDVDILVRGRTTDVEGTARVTIYHDYTCVYDIGLCDFFWNLIDPPKPTGPDIIQNRLEFTYETLVDCANLTTPINFNIAINAPILLTIDNIPTFKNGNALLLIKSSYTPEVQGFYFPVGNELEALNFSNCSSINTNLPLMQRLNREFLLLPNNSNPVTDSYQIRSLLASEDSYLYVKPQFSFPPDDNIKDCNPNEIVIAGIGYVFKNWTNGSRQDDIVFGVNLLFPQGLYTSPQIDLCYRYYYNQKET